MTISCGQEFRGEMKKCQTKEDARNKEMHMIVRWLQKGTLKMSPRTYENVNGILLDLSLQRLIENLQISP